MSTTTTAPPRPSQVTFAGWLTIGASVIAVAMAFSEVSQLGSLETQQTIQTFLSDGPGRSLGLSLAEVQDLLRVTSTAAAACAATTAVLGWFVLQRSRSSRLALSVLAVPLLVAGLFSGGFATAVVAASATMLWLQPARGWFNGVLPDPAPKAPVSAAAPGHHGSLPAPTSAPLYPAVRPGAQPIDRAAGPRVGTDDQARRPAAVVWACALTWLFTTLAAVLLLFAAIVMATDAGLLLDEAHRQNPDLASQGISDTTIKGAVFTMAAVVVVWSVAAAACAVLAWRQVRWAMLALLVSAFAAGGLCLLLSVGSLLLLPVVAACAGTIVLLLRSDVRHWYAAAPPR